MRIPRTRIWGSVFLVCVGIILFPAYKHWVATRTWVAVDTPVSLAPGHARVDNFHVNLSSEYYINIELSGHEYWRDPKCEDHDVVRTRWWLLRKTHTVATWKDFWGDFWSADSNGPTRGVYLGAFDGSGGTYDLDVEMVSDGTCLQAFHPRLRVYADDSDYVRGGWIYAIVILASCGLIGVGVVLPLVSAMAAVGRLQVNHGESLAIFDALRAERESIRRKLLFAERTQTLPTIGWVYAQTYLLLFLGIVPFFCNWRRSYGIPVRLLRPGVIQASTDSGITGLLVYVDQNGNLYLNSKAVKEDELPRALQAELGHRADWSVYVDGDSKAEYADVVRAMALVRSVGGKVIMMTPRMRAEAEARRK